MNYSADLTITRWVFSCLFVFVLFLHHSEFLKKTQALFSTPPQQVVPPLLFAETTPFLGPSSTQSCLMKSSRSAHFPHSFLVLSSRARRRTTQTSGIRNALSSRVKNGPYVPASNFVAIDRPTFFCHVSFCSRFHPSLKMDVADRRISSARRDTPEG